MRFHAFFRWGRGQSVTENELFMVMKLNVLALFHPIKCYFLFETSLSISHYLLLYLYIF